MSTAKNHDLKTKIDKANSGHYYINVTDAGDGKFKSSHVKLTGAERMFEKDPNFVYCRPLRHSGNRDVLNAYFLSIGSKESDMKAYLADSYSLTNFVKMINEYNREVAKMPPNTHKAKIAHTKLTLDYIISTKEQLKELKMESTRAHVPVERSPPPIAGGGRQTLKSRIESLEQDKVMDITSFDSAKKTGGIKTIKKPSAKASKQALGTTSILKRIYFDFSKPTENAIAALVFLKYSQDKATKIVNDAVQAHSVDLGSVAIKH